MHLRPSIHIIQFSSLVSGKSLLCRLRESSRRIYHDFKITPLRELYKLYFESILWLPPIDEVRVHNRLVVKSHLSSKAIRKILAQVPLYVISIKEIDDEEYESIINSLPVMIRKRSAL